MRARIEQGGARKYHEAAAAAGKLFARERIALLIDEGSFAEDGRYANVLADGLPADGVVTGTATIDGRPVALMANDSTVKAGSWGARTVEKIIRIIEKAYGTGVPMIYLVDSAGARITDQVEMFPGRLGADTIFHSQVRPSGALPQLCALLVPSPAGGAYIPAFCDYVAMVDGNASMYPAACGWSRWRSRRRPRWWRWAAPGCTAPSRVRPLPGGLERDALEAAGVTCPTCRPAGDSSSPPGPAAGPVDVDLRRWSRPASGRPRHAPPPAGLVDAESFFEIHQLWARELTIGFARLVGRSSAWSPTTRCSRAACSSSTPRQGDPVHPAVRCVQRAAAVPGRRARVHGRHGGGEAGHHPARCEDDAPCRRRPCRRFV